MKTTSTIQKTIRAKENAQIKYKIGCCLKNKSGTTLG
jgi:hypothetical protein